MSKIEKLSIAGVRSFDPRDVMAIKFFTPLTLIVGMNGSGKTTIIECLKYVTCGELPPNSEQGRSFVHDPKMAGEKDVLGQIKIAFKSTEGMNMVTSRTLSLSFKQDKRTFKALEGSIRMAKDGERNTISSRVGDINTMMPRFLGVSKAVLENVIFCHQEDSLWPMLPPTQLKVKFDEIFEAHKYSKAIDNIKVMQKNKRIELKNLEIEEGHCKKDNERRVALKHKISEMDARLAALREESKIFSNQRKEAESEYREAANKWAEYNVIVGELNNKRTERKIKDENVRGLRENLNDMSESDNELQHMLEQFDERLQSFEADLAEQKKLYSEKDTSVSASRQNQSAKVSAIGRFEEQKASYDRQMVNRNRLIQESARTHEIRGYDRDLDDKLAKEFMQKLTRATRDAQSEFERVRSEAQDKASEQQKVLNRLHGEASALLQTKESSRQQINTYENKISDIQRRRKNIKAEESDKVTLEGQLSDANSKLQAAKAKLETASWNVEIDSSEVELRRLAGAREKLDAEQSEAARRAGESAQIDYMQKQFDDRQRSLDIMTKAHGERITEAVGTGWKPQTLASLCARAVEEVDTEVADAKKQRDGTQIQADNVSSKLSELKSTVRAKQNEVKSAEKDIYSAVGCAPKDFPEELAYREEARDVRKQEGESLDMIKGYFQTAIKTAETKDCCRMCARYFEDKTEMQKMIKIVQDEQKKLTQSIDPRMIQEAEAAFEEAKKVGSLFDTWERLTQKEIPAVEREIEEAEQKWKKANKECEEQTYAFKEKESRKQEFDSLKTTIDSIVQLSKETAALDTQIKELAVKQKAEGISRGLEAVQADIKKIDADSKAQQAIRDDAVSKRDRKKTAVGSLELEVSNLNGKLAQAIFDLKERKDLDEQEQENKTYIAQAREKMHDADAKLDANASETATQQAKYDDICRRGASRDREQQNKYNKLNNSLNRLSAVEADMKAYHDRGGDDQLERAKREKDEADAEVDVAVAEMHQIARNIKKLTDQSQSYAESKRNITDNQRYRRDRRQLQELSAEIEQMEERGAEADAAKYQREARRWQAKRDEASAQQAQMVGEMKGLDAQLQSSIAEYASDYKHADRRYKAAHVKVTTTKAAIQDLGAYSSALDKAIMQYHTMKMEQINAIIADLWRKTYMGTDVDSVMIRSENETVKATKNYNYRVVMVKQDTEMDMRGRCSAGQKVLASIIIRMALAECFGVRCGVIALDEPTTNLDSENIRALGMSLSEIIKDRKKQPNFQLIVITHDEHFLRHMNCSDHADEYYYVSRSEKQTTQIHKQSIAEVM